MTDINPNSVSLMSMSVREVDDALAFNCGDWEAQDFLLNQAVSDQQVGLSNTIICNYNGKMAAFVALCCDCLRLVKGEGQAEETINVPAIKIVRFGQDKNFNDQDFLGLLVDYAKNIAYELSTSNVGVRYLTIDTPADKEEYFAGKGFVRNTEPGENGIISMRADIFV